MTGSKVIPTLNPLPVSRLALLSITFLVLSSSSPSEVSAVNGFNHKLHTIAIANSRPVDPSFKFSARLTGSTNNNQVKVNSRQSPNGDVARAVAFAADPKLNSDTLVNNRLSESTRSARAVPPLSLNQLQPNTTKLTRSTKLKKSKKVEARALADSTTNARNGSSSSTSPVDQSTRSGSSSSILKASRKINRKSFANNQQSSAFAATGSAQGHNRLTSVSLTQPSQNPKVTKRRRGPIKNELISPSPPSMSSPVSSPSAAITQKQPQNTPTSGSESLNKDAAPVLAYVWKDRVSTFGQASGSTSSSSYVRTVQHNGRTWLQSNVGQVQLPGNDDEARYGHVVELLGNNRLQVRPATSAEQQRLISPRPKSTRTNAQLNQANQFGAFNPFSANPQLPDFAQLFANSFPSF